MSRIRPVLGPNAMFEIVFLGLITKMYLIDLSSCELTPAIEVELIKNRFKTRGALRQNLN